MRDEGVCESRQRTDRQKTPPKPLLLLFIFSTKAALRSSRICCMGSHCSLTKTCCYSAASLCAPGGAGRSVHELLKVK